MRKNNVRGASHRASATSLAAVLTALLSLLAAACSTTEIPMAPDVDPGTRPITLAANGVELWVSQSSDRSNPVLLAGAALSGTVYIFVAEDDNVREVHFYLDGQFRQREGIPEYDFSGTGGNGQQGQPANGWGVGGLSSGSHTIRADVRMADGSVQTLQSTFSVGSGTAPPTPVPTSLAITPTSASLQPGQSQQFSAVVRDQNGSPMAATISWSETGGTISSSGNYTAGSTTGTFRVIAASGSLADTVQVTISSPPPPPSGGPALWVSSSSNRSSPVLLAGQSLTGTVYIFVAPESGIGGVNFYLDGQFRRREGIAAYDFNGTGGDGGTGQPAIGWDTGGIAGGSHTIRADVTINGTAQTIQATFSTGSGSPTPPPPPSLVPTSLTISPGSVTLETGTSHQFSAVVRDQNGNPMSATIGWSETGGSITQGGNYTAGSTTGTNFRVVAASGSLADTAQVTITAPPPPPPPSGNDIFPGQSIQAAVNANPAGTTFTIKAGRHVQQSVSPKNDMTFIGENGAILDGQGATLIAFHPTGDRVTIRNLIIENYNNPVQTAAIMAGGHTVGDGRSGWLVEGNELRFNRGGIRVGNAMTVRNNYVHDNTEIGILGVGNNVLIEGNEVARNNTSDSNHGFEAGGIKIVLADGLTIRNNFSHHNNGKGIWTDAGVINYLVEGNRVEDNTRGGIMHEISYRAVIRNNTVLRNGVLRPVGWAWDGGIVVANSPDVEVYGNTVIGNGDGITGIQQNRGPGPHGPTELRNFHVHDNVIEMTRAPDYNGQQTGISQDHGNSAVFTSWNNRFVNNRYTLGSLTAPYFTWANGHIGVLQWKAQGQDLTGVFN